MRFIDQYRSYVINYNLGKDMVKRYVESQGGTACERDEALGGVRAADLVAAAAVGACGRGVRRYRLITMICVEISQPGGPEVLKAG